MGDKPEVVWWDPAVLALNVEEEISLRQRRILEADPHGTAAAASEENYTRWKRERDEVLARASRSLIVPSALHSHRTRSNPSSQVAFKC
jgi:hypothetical protein